MSLHDLHADLLYLILRALGSPRDLDSLIRASPSCFRLYTLSPEVILSSVLKNAILPDALHHAIAHSNLPAALSTSEPDRAEHLEAFLDQYFQPDSFAFPTEKTALVALSRLYARVSHFVDDYSARAVRALGLDPNTASPLSSTERARLQRAFFRHELYCRAFPVDYHTPSHSLVPADLQCTQFIVRLEPWEVEELSCVHHYFMFLTGTFVDLLEDQLVGAVHAAPGVRHPPNSDHVSGQQRVHSPTTRLIRHYLHSSTPALAENQLGLRHSRHHHHVEMDEMENEESASGDDIVRFNPRGLGLFSGYDKFRSRDIIGHLASLGSAFHYRLAQADGEQRKDMIRENVLQRRDFLPEALYHSLDLDPYLMPDDIDHDQPSHPNLGYALFNKWDVYSPIVYFRGPDNCPLRQRAFVFWDAERILLPAVNNSLQEAVTSEMRERLIFRAHPSTASAQQRLDGFGIPRTQMERITQEFGSVNLGEHDRLH